MTTLAADTLTDRECIEQEVARRTAQDWLVVSRTDSAVQFRRPKRWSVPGLAVFVALPLLSVAIIGLAGVGLALLGLLLVALGYATAKDEAIYVIAAQLRAVAQGQAMKIREGSAARCSVCGKGVRAAATECKHW